MSIVDLKRNLSEAKKIITDIKLLNQRIIHFDSRRKTEVISGIHASFNKLMLINRAIPDILKDVSTVKKLECSVPSTVVPEKRISTLSYTSLNSSNKNVVALKKEDRAKFAKELKVTESRIKKAKSSKDKKLSNQSSYSIISHKFFGWLTNRIAKNFSGLKKDLTESNSKYLLPTYLSIAFFSSLLFFLTSSVTLGVLFFLKLKVLFYVWIPVVIPFFIFLGFYLMPTMNRTSVKKRISNELPFAVIYMAAISGSNIEPTKIFKIISDSSEYKSISIEMKKVLAQVEVYGYNLVTALKNVAKFTVSAELAELLNGMATAISTGSSLKNYLEKKSEGLLTNYRLERNRYTEVSATFMDIYISVLITAPLLLVMLIVIMDLTELSLGGLSTDVLLFASMFLVAIVNIFFIIFLQIKQPTT